MLYIQEFCKESNSLLFHPFASLASTTVVTYNEINTRNQKLEGNKKIDKN